MKKSAVSNSLYLALIAFALYSIALYSIGNAHALAADGIQFVDCGSTSNGLAVKAASVQPRQFACPRASLVGERYLRAVRKKVVASVRISVTGTTWICRERLYDTNPVTECVNRRDPRELVVLVS
ncbi:hypothetical protein [Lysobacter sp. 1R34A]|uniref:hypothetical protein n=1 Tax=Lysobacter sp. 1R34A TaxID=3445786 RepID=UPI003EEB6439